ncbi:RNA polymerase-binding transcription factor DksA [uncultured Gammaproteobacteria bacterium]|jgi:DnaK suppressor protein|nr:RNA polymerase-binding transcription factor DksA [Bathymodiolus brooksi thiotrophic gill symbiont]CAC9542094.1 RNA polymerase-binding transcription factor DksA [uncultured Gammaproteobacteria bacterium]CAB9543716.1 RNA polymerase-binding transcription factor DksA [Bathymodiolus brooksi thiotrophic gill symbiont]CAC9548657.1 RNA polymerase-binding transcription factor DksA [uncultured Gammaproteobacteria bacterium]CAC9551791.1 RNA polymerase-binding transcription factor DksA [uncultured Gamma
MSEPHFQNISNYQSKKNEEFMSNAQIEHFKTKLNVWKDQLIDDAKTTITHIQEDSSKVADINDRATLEEEFALELRTRDRERKLISKIEATLHIIELGDYGYCKTCGAEISLMRLEARPTADECIDCKTIAERKEI